MKEKKTDDTAIVKASDYDLDEKRASEIQASFEPMLAERRLIAEEYEAIIKEEIDEDVSQRARVLRLQLVKVRTGIADTHRTQKHMFLMAGRFVDAWKNASTLPVAQMEKKLTEIERHFENIERERLDKLRSARAMILLGYDVPDEQIPAGLAEMEEFAWNAYAAGVAAVFQQRKDAEAKAEEERIAQEKAEAAERERIRLENEQLKKEAAERDKAEKTRAAKEAKEREKREKAERARLEKEAKAREKAEAAAKAERLEAEARFEKERKVARKAREKLEAAAKEASDKLKRAEKERVDREEAARKEREAVEAREKNKKHRNAVNDGIATALMAVDGLSRDVCVKIVNAIESGKIPNVTVNY